MQELLFELKGPHYDLASAEVKCALEGSDSTYRIVDICSGVLHVETSVEPKKIGRRLGLTHRIYYHILNCDETELIEGTSGIRLPPGSASVSTRRIQGKKARTEDINIGLGSEISKRNAIDLDRPDHRIIVMISDKYFVGRLAYEIDNKPFQNRLSRNRPFFSPVSLEPKLARALINLARPKEGAYIHDPFCGTGGILLEAGDMNLNASGGDIDERMVGGSKENLEFYGFDVSVVQGDVSESTSKYLDCIVTDPPYGRSSSSQGEDICRIYRRLFETSSECLKNKGYLSVIFPDKSYYEIGSKYMEPVEMYRVYVHNSLERFFCVFRKQ